MSLIESLPAWLVGLITLFLILTAILWALLPFAVFGIKERLDQQINNLHNINQQLRAQSILLQKIEEALNKERRTD